MCLSTNGVQAQSNDIDLFKLVMDLSHSKRSIRIAMLTTSDFVLLTHSSLNEINEIWDLSYNTDDVKEYEDAFFSKKYGFLIVMDYSEPGVNKMDFLIFEKYSKSEQIYQKFIRNNKQYAEMHKDEVYFNTDRFEIYLADLSTKATIIANYEISKIDNSKSYNISYKQ